MTDARTLLKKQFLLLLSLASVHCIPPPKQSCECFLFLKDELWLPDYLVMTLTNDQPVDCSDFEEATETCKRYCSDEISVLNSLYQKDPTILRDYPPSQNIPCSLLPSETLSFSKVCGSQNYVLSSIDSGPPVCCNDTTEKTLWCGSEGGVPRIRLVNSNSVVEGRKLDLEKAPNDESHNEIDDSPSSGSKPVKNKTKIPFVSGGTESWMKTALKFFGHDSVTGLIKSIDIFSFPSKVQSAIRTYKDEVSMGRCYMEFTTFKVFTKQEKPWEGLLRRRRDVAYMEGPVTRFDEDIGYLDYQNYDDVQPVSSESAKAAEAESIRKIVGGISGILERSESTRQYADILSSFLPVITQMMSSGGGGGGSSGGFPLATLLKLAGPFLAQMGGARPSVNSNRIETVRPKPTFTRPPVRPSPTSSTSSDSTLTSMLMKMVGNVVSSFFAPQGTRIKPTAPLTTRPTKPSTTARPPALDAASSGISKLINLFLQNAVKSPPVARPIETPKPKPSPAPQKTAEIKVEEKERDFIDLVLELIRPLFISILGTAPGESGVKAIRRASTQSTLGRVDDSLREEVDSPLFCLKRYMVNKAWSVTENGLRTFIQQFTPEEQARMMHRMLA